METTLERLDFLVLAVYLVAVVGLGSYFARGVKTSEDFFLAGRRFGWFPLGLSIVVSLFSANGLLSTTGYVYSQDLQYITIAPMVLPVLLLVLYVFLPVFHRYRVTTVYQYVDHRLGPGSHLLTTLAFLLKRLACAIPRFPLYASPSGMNPKAAIPQGWETLGWNTQSRWD